MSKSQRTTFDTLTQSGRSALMAKIKSKDTKPEIILRQALHRDGLRFRNHRKDLPGKPDIAVEKYKLIIDVRGCFWHGHENCPDGHTPKSNIEFWINKLKNNKSRDKKNLEKLSNLGYEVFVFWECEIKRKGVLQEKLQVLYDYLNTHHDLKIVQKPD